MVGFNQATSPWVNRLVNLLMGLPWLEIVAETWKFTRKLWRGLANEGLYEVLNYEVTLELKDRQGKQAVLRKRERVRYLQNNIIAYQDQAWGEGDFLANYHCHPGIEVDRYRLGYKTYILISLRETKQKGDIDDFVIEREIHNGFLKSTEYCEVEISHKMKRVRLEVGFPRTRRPLLVSLLHQMQRKTESLKQNHVRQLPDGRWLAWWETKRPRLYEHYVLQWDW